MNMEDFSTLQAKVIFQQKIGKAYSMKCPQLTSYIGSRLAATLRKVGVQSFALCPYCCTPLFPANTSTRTLTHGQLKTKRRLLHVRGHDMYSAVQKPHKSYIVVHCKVCDRGSVVGGHKDREAVIKNTHKEKQLMTTPVLYNPTTPSIKSTRQHQSNVSLATPTTASTQKKRCGLKAALQQTHKFKHVQTNHLGASPRLSHFLTSLQE